LIIIEISLQGLLKFCFALTYTQRLSHVLKIFSSRIVKYTTLQRNFVTIL